VLDGACLALMDVSKIKAPASPAHDKGGAIAFEVDDLKAFVKQLRDRGVKILADNIASPGCTQAFVMDPSGNAVGLHQKSADRL
jgi:predicted enzyme related to lactoylglutathione lyase